MSANNINSYFMMSMFTFLIVLVLGFIFLSKVPEENLKSVIEKSILWRTDGKLEKAISEYDKMMKFKAETPVSLQAIGCYLYERTKMFIRFSYIIIFGILIGYVEGYIKRLKDFRKHNFIPQSRLFHFTRDMVWLLLFIIPTIFIMAYLPVSEDYFFLWNYLLIVISAIIMGISVFTLVRVSYMPRHDNN